MKNWMIILASVLLITGSTSATTFAASDEFTVEGPLPAESSVVATDTEPAQNATTAQQNANTILQSTTTQGVGLDG